jgi:hypothetical protein
MVSVTEVPVIQDTMQSLLVSVRYCGTGHNVVMASVSEVPVIWDTMQSWLVSVRYLSDGTQCSHG